MQTEYVTEQIQSAAEEIWAIWERFSLQMDDDTLGEAIRQRNVDLRSIMMDSLQSAYRAARLLQKSN